MPSSYDELSSEEQAIVRREWAERIEERRAALDLAGEFAALGRSWVELDDEGQVVERHPDLVTDETRRGRVRQKG